MTGVPLGSGAYNRTYAQEPEIQLLNRFLERAPTNPIEQTILLTRPGNAFLVGAGDGPIRMIKTQPGAFNGDLFFVSGESLFRYDGTTITPIAGTVALGGNPSADFVVGDATAVTTAYEHLFIADGTLLQFYPGLSKSKGTLTVTTTIVATETVTVDTAYYEWTAGSVDAGSPAGTMADPYLLALGVDTKAALLNLIRALNLSGTAGTDYSTVTQKNANVEGLQSDELTAIVRARVAGVGGDSIATTETMANASWAAATLEGGGIHQLDGVETPDDVAMKSVVTLASHVIVVPANSQRFYWILPGEIIIDPLDFATAESEPDQIIEAVRVGDSVYMVGQSSTEVWYANAAATTTTSRFLRQQGLAFNQGGLEGTVVPIRTQLFVVAEDGVAYQIAGGPKRVSNNGIEERIRLGIVADT